MKRLLRWVFVPAVVMALSVQTADAASWTFHFKGYGPPPNHPEWGPCPGGMLEVWATHDCQILGDEPWFSGFAATCETYSGQVADEVDGVEVNDILLTFDWGIDGNYGCGNYDEIKFVKPTYDDGTEEWVLEHINPWIDANVGEGGSTAPDIGDGTGDIQFVFTVVDLSQWDDRPLEEEYVIVDGECPDLPGYLIGTTPITFNPSAGPDDNPFETTPLTGTLPRTGEVTFYPVGVIPTVSEWGLLIFALLAAAVGTVMFGRRRCGSARA